MGEQYGVRFHDGSVLHPWNGRTQEQRAREFMQEHRVWVTERRGEVRRIDQVSLVVRSGPDDPWREVDA